jgi:hypothetical protein
MQMTVKPKNISAVMRELNARRTHHGGGRPPIIIPCERCQKPLSATERRTHGPKCPGEPGKKGGRPLTLRPCPHCGIQLGARALKIHAPRCGGKR